MDGVTYHNATNLRRDSASRDTRRTRSQSSRPRTFKHYPETFARHALPREPGYDTLTLAECLAGPEALSQPLDEHRLSRILALTAGLTAQAGAVYLRATPSAGARYPVEIYVALDGLGSPMEAGLHHYDPAAHALTHLRRGDAVGYAASACNLCGTAESMACVILFTTVFERTVWTYGERGYRYTLLDAGHAVENCLLACRLEHLAAAPTADFADPAVNSLLAVDETRESCCFMVGVYRGMAPSGAVQGPEPGAMEPLTADDRENLQAVSRMAEAEIETSLVEAMRRAGEMASPPSTLAPGPVMDAAALGLAEGPAHALPGAAELFAEREIPSLAETIFKRRSQRDFASRWPEAIPLEAFLRLLCERLDGGVDEPDRTVAVGLAIGDVPGWTPGLHLLHRRRGETTLVLETPAGAALKELAGACLGQGWLARAPLHVLFMTRPDALDESLGPRGYRRAGLLAGRLGERAYLAATALGLGACGVGAFYDEEAKVALGLGEGAELLYLVGTGGLRSV